jgi:outer membrane receptor for ferrienterochelin and colicin
VKTRLLFVIVLLMLTTFIRLDAGTTGKIVGQVTDARTGDPLIGVNISLAGTYLGGTTDADGAYLLLNVPPGRYTLTFQYIGYQRVEIPDVAVSVDFTTKQNLAMKEESIELGEVIVVSAERDLIRQDLTASQAEVTFEDIQTMPVEEFEDVIRMQSGVTRDEGGGFHIRGGRSSEVTFWVDGISVTDVFDGSNGVEIENNAIQSLQVISGTFNAEYGQAMSGIINVVTRDGGPEYKGEVSAYLGDYISAADDIFTNIDDVNPTDIYDYSFSLSGPVPFTSNKVTFFTNARHNYTDGYLYGQREVNTDGSAGDSAFVAMNRNRWLTWQNKLTWQIQPMMKLRLGFNFENREYNLYNHFFKYNPDGDLERFQTGYNGSLTLDHSLDATTFYTVKVGRFEKEYEHYVYQDPFDPRYVDNTNPDFAVTAFEFSKGGQNTNHFLRNTRSDVVKFDITSQLTDKHLVKAGVEGRMHRLNLEDYFTINGTPSDTLFTPVQPPENHINYGAYTFEPIEFSVYLQDKMEYDEFILNIGLRFDYFDSRGNILADPMDPSRYTPLREQYDGADPASLESVWYKKATPKYSISPRIGMAFPISADGVIHASYGHFAQIPEFRLLYENPAFKITRGQSNLLGNADLKPQQTVMYEIGLQQQLSADIAIDVTGFYRDIRNWVGTSLLNETYRPDIFYSQYENRDYANIRGITFTLKKAFANHFSANLSYTFQIAEGNASDPIDGFNDIQSNREPRRNIIPMDWDRTHVLNASMYAGYESWGLSLLGSYESGLPYTPNPVQGTQRGADVTTGSLALAENSKRRPDLISVDMQLTKEVPFAISDWKTNLVFFVKVFNVFDTRNEQGVWDDTGRATYTLRSAVSGADADERYIIRPDFYTAPRRVQLGLSFNF